LAQLGRSDGHERKLRSCGHLGRRSFRSGLPGFDIKTEANLVIIKHVGRGERIRTSDPLVPNQVLYQAEPLPELTMEGCLRAEEVLAGPLRMLANISKCTRDREPLDEHCDLRLHLFSMNPVQQLDLRGLHILDGAMATELERRGFSLDGPLWSAHVLESSPEAIAAVHRDYLEAGADCLLTASYQVSAEGFQQVGLNAQAAAKAAENGLRASVTIAERVRREYQATSPRRVWIAASLGPYGAMLHNGAEYHGNYACSFDDLVGFHARRIAVLAETEADFLAFESIPSLEEAKAILSALRPYPDVPAYLSFTCRDEKHVSHGETLRECGGFLDEQTQVIGIGVNCTRPELISSLIRELTQVTRKPIVVYPNSGEQWDAVHRRWHGDGEILEFGKLAQSWQSAGAQWIGGCCRTGPEHVRIAAAVWHRPVSRT
jgi:homocysteine S-methyltransferase